MEPVSAATAAVLYYSVKGLLDPGATGLTAADQRVAEEAQAHGISKEAAWAAIHAKTKRRNDERAERLFDPLGWKAAARTFAAEDDAKRSEDPRTPEVTTACGASSYLRPSGNQ